jgi:hypothetical protein
LLRRICGHEEASDEVHTASGKEDQEKA